MSSKIFADVLAQVPPETTERVKAFLDALEKTEVVDTFSDDDFIQPTKKMKIRDLDKTVKSDWTTSSKMVSTLRKEDDGLDYAPIPLKSNVLKQKEHCPNCGKSFVLKNGKFPQHGERGFHRYLHGTEKKDCVGSYKLFVCKPTNLKKCLFEGEEYKIADKVWIETHSYDLHYKKRSHLTEYTIKKMFQNEKGLFFCFEETNGDVNIYNFSKKITKAT